MPYANQESSIFIRVRLCRPRSSVASWDLATAVSTHGAGMDTGNLATGRLGVAKNTHAHRLEQCLAVAAHRELEVLCIDTSKLIE